MFSNSNIIIPMFAELKLKATRFTVILQFSHLLSAIIQFRMLLYNRRRESPAITFERAGIKMSHKKRKVLTLAGVLCTLAVFAGVIFAMTFKTAPAYTATCYADIDIEGYGVITVALDGESAPETVKNFVTLAQSGFYDGLTFHRIIEGFMMQGGDPNGDGTGGSGTTITGEFSANGIENNLSHTRGAVSMARSDDYNSASSQFFIVQQDSTYLDGSYAVFGYVTSGMDIVDEICAKAEPIDDNGLIPPEEQPVIRSIRIYE